jgi:hypothetical protein
LIKPNFDLAQFQSEILFIPGSTSADSLKIQVDRAFKNQCTYMTQTLSKNYEELNKYQILINRERTRLSTLFSKEKGSADPMIRSSANRQYLELLRENALALQLQTNILRGMEIEVARETSDEAKQKLLAQQFRVAMTGNIRAIDKNIQELEVQTRRLQRQSNQAEREQLQFLYGL